MEARSVAEIPSEPGWQFEPKWDGFRALVFRKQARVEIRGRSGKALGRYFPEVVARFRALQVPQLVLDGKLVISQGNVSSFDLLQQRLHPAASRIRRLAAQTPATFIAFDCLMNAQGRALLDAPLIDRRAALEALFAELGTVAGIRLSPRTRNARVARRWLESAGGALDGVVGKRLAERYRSGERAMIKVKKLRTADCVVGGFRYRKGTKSIGSLLLGLYDQAGKLDHVGFTASLPRNATASLRKKLEARIRSPGFTGKAPGAPSRWSAGQDTAWKPLRPDLVVEVIYDQVTGERFRHGTKFMRWRPEKNPRDCTFEQLQRELDPRLIRRLLAAR